jgi:hypothetical protein
MPVNPNMQLRELANTDTYGDGVTFKIVRVDGAAMDVCATLPQLKDLLSATLSMIQGLATESDRQALAAQLASAARALTADHS